MHGDRQQRHLRGHVMTAKQAMTRRLGIPLAAVALLTAPTLSGCGNEADELEPGTVAVTNPDPRPMIRELEGVPMSPEQTSALADAVVTEEEYLAGFERFRACVRDGGFDLESVTRHGPLVWYEYTEEARPTADECYWREWQELDGSWQIGHPDATEEFEALNYCLELDGHHTGTTIEEVEKLFAESGLDRQTCIEQWLDSGLAWGE
ncbi:hypothetical protein [Pseudactinotalea sp. HY158]|uniref:hypothetical protein n=1 Tax=Pseudactinotalea sp. HY158 TaxID=2654547 RepID=UPI00129C5D35|nr:hypothetical protein [Pseudactinotalea sp. HY158]QGH68223.1 hypothetical protein GCE65_00835 [Pseudactinotalea sp. HY158]